MVDRVAREPTIGPRGTRRIAVQPGAALAWRLETPSSGSASLTIMTCSDGKRVCPPERVLFAFATIVIGLVSACAPAVRQPSRAVRRRSSTRERFDRRRGRAAAATDESADSAPPEAPDRDARPIVRRAARLDDGRPSSSPRCLSTVLCGHDVATDTSALTEPSDWREACAAPVAPVPAREFFERHFAPVVVEDGTGLPTGYSEPAIGRDLGRAPRRGREY